MAFYSQNFEHLSLKQVGHILWMTLNNPEQSNAITLAMVDSLTRVLKHADFDSSIRVIVIGGEGSAFCAGGDVKAMQARTGMFEGNSNELRMRYIHGIQQIPKTIEDLSKPLIAMVNGPAVGAGCDLAMMCDVRIGTTKAKFAENFVRLGLVAGDGGSFFLQRVIGYAKAMQMSLTGEFVVGEQAHRWGLLNLLVSEEALLEETTRLAETIAQNAPVGVQMTKKLMKLAYLNDSQATLDMAAAYQGIAQRTDDHFLALQALKEKKVAQFQGQ